MFKDSVFTRTGLFMLNDYRFTNTIDLHKGDEELKGWQC